jgi:hypothetical protein
LIPSLIIIVVLILLYFFFFRKKSSQNAIPTKNIVVNQSAGEVTAFEPIDEEEIFLDENGREFRLVEKTREVPRKTYLKANLNGKYWGQIDDNFSNQFQQSNFFDFNIYEASLENAVYSELPFKLKPDLNIPRGRLPKLIHTILEKDGREYEVNLLEPIFADFKINRRLHQSEGNEVFGTIEAVVAGYVLDFIQEQYTEKEYLTSTNEAEFIPEVTQPLITKSLIPTGNVEVNGDYKRIEFFYSDFKKTYWGDWKYIKPPTPPAGQGCFSSIIGLIGIALGIIFLLLILPQLLFVLPFLLILFLLNFIPNSILVWLFRIIGGLILLWFFVSLFQFFSRSSTTFIPNPNVIDIPRESETETTPIIDSTTTIAQPDTLIKHFRSWKDYDGNQYEGYIYTKNSDYIDSKNYKSNLKKTLNTPREYDELIYLLKENDKNNLEGVYQLFDSINEKKQFSDLKFAELIVSFVQDISYALIVPGDCDPRLYDDEFVKEYLSSDNPRCDGFEKFGINTPVEFMSNLYGDCDSRTLLLYTMLAHYGFDVALMSSEYYSHSIIGINLPISGIAYKYQNQRYVLWETTAPNVKAGVLPEEISNLNYWRISLKSK